MKEFIKRTGLKELPPDPRDFKTGAVIRKWPKLESLPADLELPVDHTKDQINDFCSGNMVALLIGTNEGKEMDENWSFAKSKELSGDPEEWGQDLRTAFQVGVKFGGLPKSRSPYTSEKGDQFLRYPENWPKVLEFYARPFKQKTFFAVTGPYDAFDNIRAAIAYMRKRGQEQGAGIGVLWNWDPENPIVDTITNSGEGHALSVMGWNTIEGKIYLNVKNSWGKDVGHEGTFYFSREVVNHFVGQYGSFIFVDLSKKEAMAMLENGGSMDDWWFRVKNAIRWFFKEILR